MGWNEHTLGTYLADTSDYKINKIQFLLSF